MIKFWLIATGSPRTSVYVVTRDNVGESTPARSRAADHHASIAAEALCLYAQPRALVLRGRPKQINLLPSGLRTAASLRANVCSEEQYSVVATVYEVAAAPLARKVRGEKARAVI